MQCIGNCLGTVSGTKQLWQRECAGACTTHVDVRERAWHVQPTWEKTWPWGMGFMCRVATAMAMGRWLLAGHAALIVDVAGGVVVQRVGNHR